MGKIQECDRRAMTDLRGERADECDAIELFLTDALAKSR